MAHFVTQPDGTQDLYLTADEAACLGSAITRARPRGDDATPDGRIRVHVHADAAPGHEPHEPIQ